MFTLQQSQIQAALTRGGLAPDAATEVASIIGNCIATLAHRGPVLLDYTPPSFGYITPELRKFQFPNMDAQSLNPDYVPSGGDFSETGIPPTDSPITEPQGPRPPFGPSSDPDGGGGGLPAVTNYFVSLGLPPPQKVSVVKRVYADPITKKWMVQYQDILCWPGPVAPAREWMQTREIRVVNRLHVAGAGIYADKYRVRVPVVANNFDELELDAAECSTGGAGA